LSDKNGVLPFAERNKTQQNICNALIEMWLMAQKAQQNAAWCFNMRFLL